jgi:hypothetical protein
MNLPPMIYVLRAGARVSLVWPRIVKSDSKIMARAIQREQESAREYQREFTPELAVRNFQISTQAQRLSDSEANQLLLAVYKVMEEEGTLGK